MKRMYGWDEAIKSKLHAIYPQLGHGQEVLESLDMRIVSDCVDFIESRNRHFNVNSFKELFEKVPSDSISSYLHEIRLKNL